MCINTVSQPNVSRYDDISIYRYNSNKNTDITVFLLVIHTCVLYLYLQVIFEELQTQMLLNFLM